MHAPRFLGSRRVIAIIRGARGFLRDFRNASRHQRFARQG
jgi:hypothetical protein